MNDFRKVPRHTSRQAVDGFISASDQSGPGEGAMRANGINADRFRSSAGRPVGDFKRPAGYHSANTVAAPMPKTAAQAAKQPSILNMTLPGGALDDKKKRKNKDKPKQGRWRSIRKWTFRSALMLIIICMVGGGFLFVKGYGKINKVFKGGGNGASLQENVAPELLKGEGDGRVNILLLGKGGEGHDGPDLTDTILLASIDPVNKTAALVSIPRDLWVTAPGQGSSKINAVYANAKYKSLRSSPNDKAKAEAAGIAAIEKQVSDVLGAPVHYYAMLDFKAFQQAVDNVGGVDINVPEDLVDATMAWENKGSAVLARKGLQHFDGFHALMYVRSRHGSARGDFDRTERQRLLISALSQKVLSAGTYTNPVKISRLLDTFGDHVSTDLSISDSLRIMTIGKGIGGAITSVGLADPPNVLVTTGNISGQSIVRPIAGIGDFSKIQSYVRAKLQDGYILKEKAGIAILNGSGMTGLATKKSDELKVYGYTVTSVGDAPSQTYQKTVLVDLTKGKKPYTKNYLEKRFGVKAVTTLPETITKPANADFVILLGSNETR